MAIVPRILVMDDQPDVRAVIALALRVKGFEVVGVESGAAGLAIAFAARNTALYFTKWYPQYQRAKFAAPAASAGAL